MLHNQSKMKRLNQQIQQLFKISADLEEAFPSRKFTLDGHLIGSIGEVIAAFHYNLELLTSSSAKHDAVSSDGRFVQIKATQGNRFIGLRSEPEYMIVLWISSKSGEIIEIYNGPGNPVWEMCGKFVSTGERRISLLQLKQIATRIPESQRIGMIHPFEMQNSKP